MRFASWESEGRVQAGVVSAAGLHAFPDGTTVLDLVRAGLPAALAAGTAALGGPAVPVESVRLLPPLQAPTVRDFVAFEEHVEGVVKSVGDGAGVVPEWYEAPTFYFTNPYVLVGRIFYRVSPGCLATGPLHGQDYRGSHLVRGSEPIHSAYHRTSTLVERRAGMTMGHWGMQFGRTQTWWDHGAKEWLDYCAAGRNICSSRAFLRRTFCSSKLTRLARRFRSGIEAIPVEKTRFSAAQP